MLLSINLHEDLINEKCISIALVLLLQTPNIFQTELIAPQTNCLIANGDSTFSQQIFYISMAEIESMIEPDGVLNDFRLYDFCKEINAVGVIPVSLIRWQLTGMDDEIAALAPQHPDYGLFSALPGAGPLLAPRLLVAFGEQRDRFASAAELQKYGWHRTGH